MPGTATPRVNQGRLHRAGVWLRRVLASRWSFNFVLFREPAARRWAQEGTLQAPQHGAVPPRMP